MRNAAKDEIEMTARRESMLKEGFRLFSEKGIEEVSMQEVADACGVGSFIGLISDAEHIYGGEGSEPDYTADLGHKRITDGKNGWLHRITVSIDLSDTAHSGPVYLIAYTQKGQKYLIHNVVFITDKDYDAPDPVVVTEAETQEPETETQISETTAADTAAQTEKAKTEEQTTGFKPLYAIIVAACSAVIAGGIAVIIVKLKPEKEKKTDEEK